MIKHNAITVNQMITIYLFQSLSSSSDLADLRVSVMQSFPPLLFFPHKCRNQVHVHHEHSTPPVEKKAPTQTAKFVKLGAFL